MTDLFRAKLQITLTPELAAGDPTPTYDRAGAATFVDYLGVIRTVPDGAPRFAGTRYDGATHYLTRNDGTTPIDETDYWADAGGPFGYLAEGSTTNVHLHSQDLSNAVWVKGNCSVVADVATGPDGTLSADRVVPNTSTNSYKYVYQYADVTQNADYVFFTIAKADGYRYIQIMGGSAPFGTFAINIDLQTGSETLFTAGSSTVNGRGIEPLGNGYYLCWASCKCLNAGATGYMAPAVIPASDSIRGVTWSADGASGVLIGGEQFAAGTFPTSYIKTEAAPVLRAADVLTYADVGNISLAEGQISVEASTLWRSTTATHLAIGNNVNTGPLYLSTGKPSTRIRAHDTSKFSEAPITAFDMYDGPVEISATWGSELTAIHGGTPDPTPSTFDGQIVNPGERLGIGTKSSAPLLFWYGTLRNLSIIDGGAGTPDLIPQDTDQAQELDSPALVQASTIALQDIEQAHSLDSITLTQAALLTVQPLDHTQQLDNISLVAAGSLAVQDLNHAQTLDNIKLVVEFTLAPQGTEQAQELDEIVLTVAGSLGIHYADQDQSLDNIDLTVAGLLAIQDLEQAQALDHIDLITYAPAPSAGLCGNFSLTPALSGTFTTTPGDCR